MATMSIRLADNDKKAADNLFKELGITTNSAVNIFIKQCIRLQEFPFTPSLMTPSEKIQKSIEESDILIKEIKSGKRKGYTDRDSLFKSLDE